MPATRHPFRVPRALLPGLLPVLLFTLGFAQTGDEAFDIPRLKAEIAKVKRDIQKTESDLGRTDSLTREEAALAQRLEERNKKDKERRETEIAALTGKIQELQKQIQAEKSKAARADNGTDEIAARTKNYAAFLASWCDSLLLRVENCPPLEREPREERVRALKNDLLAGSASPEEGISRLASILKDEIRSGDEIAMLNRPLTLKSGEVINAQILKMGNQFALFSDEDGKRLGFLERTPEGWGTREVDDFAERLALKKAIEVKGAKQPPQLVPLEVTVSPRSIASRPAASQKEEAP